MSSDYHSCPMRAYDETQEYLLANPELKEAIDAHMLALELAHEVVPWEVSKFESGYLFPFNESLGETEASLELAQQGFYRFAFYGLRCVLELTVVALYFDRDDSAAIEIPPWIQSTQKTPNFRKSLRHLFDGANFKRFEEEFPLQTPITSHYDTLSDYVHIRGYARSSSGQTRTRFPMFRQQALRRYIHLFRSVATDCIILILLKYPVGLQHVPLSEKFGSNPPMGLFLEDGSQEVVLRALDAPVGRLLRKISDEDPHARGLAVAIAALPDLSAAGLEQQHRAWQLLIDQSKRPAQ